VKYFAVIRALPIRCFKRFIKSSMVGEIIWKLINMEKGAERKKGSNE